MSVTPLPRPRPGDEPTTQNQTYPDTTQPRQDHERDWFDRRLNDVDQALTHGWNLTAGWIKAIAVIGGTLIAFLGLHWIGSTAIDWAHALPWPTPTGKDSTGLLATIDTPVRGYLASHTGTLPITATTAYGTWQAVGAASLVLGFFHFSSARLTWVCWGLATTAMVWQGTPEPGRQVAAGIAVLAWAALSLVALRGLSLFPAAFIHVDVQAPPAPVVRAEIHMPKSEPTTYKPYDPQQPPSLN
ncbi:hypothetical protein [Streptomyces sp. NPDC056308]|uniref:hypothetical protein n=1 Tax=Streptomyces sp. NPDC056308 TaxID=3345780 RepID=UPI0035E2600B